MSKHEKAVAVILLSTAGVSFAGGPLPDVPHVYVEGSASVDFAPDSLSLSVGYFQTEMDRIGID